MAGQCDKSCEAVLQYFFKTLNYMHLVHSDDSPRTAAPTLQSPLPEVLCSCSAWVPDESQMIGNAHQAQMIQELTIWRMRDQSDFGFIISTRCE